VQRVPEQSAKRQIQEVIELKKTRDADRLRRAVERLREAAAAGENTIPYMIEATEAQATTAELMGTVREAYGYSYDPMNIIESPFR